MHILLIHQNFATLDEPGGTRHHELARYLAGQGHRVTVITSRVSYLTGKTGHVSASSMDEPGEDGVNILHAYTYAALHRSFVHRVLSFLSFTFSSFLKGLTVQKVDLVWGTSPPIFQGITAWGLSRLKGVSFLFEVRDLWPAFAVDIGVLRHPLLIRLSEWLESFLYRQASCLVINSPGFLEHVKARGACRVELVPNGADPRMFDPQAGGMEFRRKHGLQDEFVALYAGAHGMSNDLEVVLEAARRLSDRPEIVIVLLGDGKEKPVLIEMAAEMGLTNVHFLPPVPKTEMPAALAAAQACIAILKPVPLYATVYPNKVFDYMAAGRPVVLCIDGVIREVIEQAEAGIYASPGDAVALADAIRCLADDRQMGRAMGLRGRQYVETHFDRAALAHKLSALLVEVSRK